MLTLHPCINLSDVFLRVFTPWLCSDSRWHGRQRRGPSLERQTRSSPAAPHLEPPRLPQSAGKRQLRQGRRPVSQAFLARNIERVSGTELLEHSLSYNFAWNSHSRRWGFQLDREADPHGRRLKDLLPVRFEWSGAAGGAQRTGTILRSQGPEEGRGPHGR